MEKINTFVFNALAAAFIALLSWGVFTIHSLSVSTATLSRSVEYFVVENLPSRVTTLEVLVQELIKSDELVKE